MATIDWCKSQKKGINLIEPNDNLFEEYMQTAEETLDVLKSVKNHRSICQEWNIPEHTKQSKIASVPETQKVSKDLRNLFEIENF